MIDWQDMHVFVAAAQSGSFATAARRLNLDAATVGRKITRLETMLKATLLVRARTGLKLTSVGARVFEEAARAEACLNAAREAAQPDMGGGTVRISASEGFGAAILAPALPALRRSRPSLSIELAAAPGFLSLSKHEVDITVTLAPPASDRLHVEPLTDYELGLFAAPQYLAGGAPERLEALPDFDIVGYIDDLIYASELRYLDEVAPGLRPDIGSSSIQAQREIIAAGGGIGVLPCFLSGGLTRLMPETVVLKRRFWVASRKDGKDLLRIRAVRGWLSALVRERRGDLLPTIAGRTSD